MAAQIIDGKAVSAKVKEEVRQEIEREGLDVGLAVVIEIGRASCRERV